MTSYPAGTIVRILPDPEDDRVELVALGQQRGIPVVQPGATFVVSADSPVYLPDEQVPLVVLGLRSGWAGAREDQVEVVQGRPPEA